MIQKIRKSKISKFIAVYLALMIVVEILAPMQAYALTEGPSQPEFNSFTPIGTSDMVNVASGDFNYNIPVMDVGGYPINLSYDSGVTMDQEASWVGLGWNLNVGQINRQVRGLPDDFRGDEMLSENSMKKNVTIGVNPYVNFQLIGTYDTGAPGGPSVIDTVDIGNLSASLNIQYNNYTGMSATPSMGLSFNLQDYGTVGMNLTSTTTDGVSIRPSYSLSVLQAESKNKHLRISSTVSPSISYNTRQGLESFNLSSSLGVSCTAINKLNLKGGGTGNMSLSFANTTFTPSKRTAFRNTAGTFSFSVGPDAWGAHVEASLSASVGVQEVRYPVSRNKAYGYEFTDQAKPNSLLDFNREKELSVVSKTTKVLPVTNYTYDILNVQSQGLSGTFRPYRGQVGYVFDSKVEDESGNLSLGVELEGGAGVHVGANLTNSPSVTHTGPWNAQVTEFFKEKTTLNNPDYEKVYYKMVGENRTDNGYNILENQLGGSLPVTLKLSKASKAPVNRYLEKFTSGSSSGFAYAANAFENKIMRTGRENRNQVIQKITKGETQNIYLHNYIKPNSNAQNHHTAGYIITDQSGARHVFGETAYNNLKKEVTFSVGGSPDCTTGLINYGGNDNSSQNNKGIDNYFNSETTPKYAHSYLLTAVLSPDFEDLTGNGPTDDDLGAYTKFVYQTYNNYKWRVPFSGASYNEGLKTLNNDQKGSYIYGEKEIKYVKEIITKTHVAFFDLEERQDGRGVAGENGGMGSSKMYRIKSIRLYSKPDVTLSTGLIQDPGANNALILPIKTAHFVYDYSLCVGIDNNSNSAQGKLTLKKVYFTYKGSNMGKYTPYEFKYTLDPVTPNPNNINYNNNPPYNPKNYDVWGNYMPNATTSCNDPVNTTPQEFPYVSQANRAQQDVYAASWSLTKIMLPSGGLITIDYESDDYKYVQNRKALQMFKVEGVSFNGTSINTSELYNSGGDAKYVVIKTDNQTTNANYRQRYIGNLINQPIFFNFFLNMADGKKDYVQGYFKIDPNMPINFDQANSRLFIPMKQLNREGKNNNSNLVNPISLAGWYFGRQNLNREVHGQPGPSQNSLLAIAQSLANNLSGMLTIFTGPNGYLKSVKSCAKNFTPSKSWIRLQEPTGSKMGGGARVKKVMLYDSWEQMMGIAPDSPILDRYKKKYGQSYSYDLEDGTSSGVATYEPNMSKENPFIEPFYHNDQQQLAPSAVSYAEKPFGESFFPAPTVTYSRVTVTNQPSDDEETKTGKVVTQHYTSYDFPTIADYTNLSSSDPDKLTKIYQTNENSIGGFLGGMLGLPITTTTDLTLSQGFVVETNDMNGRVKKQEVYNQANALISSVEYKYSTEASNTSKLKNSVRVINKNGQSSEETIGVHYDVINDFRESYSNSKTLGVSVNVDMLPVLIPIIVGMGVPQSANHTQTLRTTVTTKVIHKTGILKETIAFDLGSRVSTKNLAWDAQSGQVLLTQTINEYDDKFYTLSYPAYWYYNMMGMTSQNIDIRGIFFPSSNNYYYMAGLGNINQTQNYLKPGDELAMVSVQDNLLYRAWVYTSDSNGVKLMKADGTILPATTTPLTFRVLKSAYRNLQASSMASITCMANPLGPNNNGNLDPMSFVYSTMENPLDWRVLNASAIEYNDEWASQCENGLPMPVDPGENPYLYNLKGEWRPYKSYAYLTGRSATTQNTRLNGFFKSFGPFYRIAGSQWEKVTDNWTYASKVSMYSPYGVELENKDALNRYSSAQYGYDYKLPVAIASNTRYREIGVDGFEDYDSATVPTLLKPHFGFSQYLNNNVYITGQTSHTGNKSIAIKQNSEARLIRVVQGCGMDEEEPEDEQPPQTAGNPSP
jgi:hypothetical protein